jgi:3-deoxy-manno-octulosonate cytidylyltransferase (CMP-KDO synthetase)
MPEAQPRVGIIIPARYASTRFPGKPLFQLKGADGVRRSLIEHSWRCARAVPSVSGVWVATDDDRIETEVQRFGGQVVRTPRECANGTERCAAALESLGDELDVIVNLQGDAPLTPSGIVSNLLARLEAEQELPVATPAVPCSVSLYRHLVEDQAAGRVGGTTVVFGAAGYALYFSKRVIPYVDAAALLSDEPPVYLHLGVYAYRPPALRDYATAPMSPLEKVEGLEQLRFLHAGSKVGVVICDRPEWDVIELNNPTDVPAVEAMLKARGIAEGSR